MVRSPQHVAQLQKDGPVITDIIFKLTKTVSLSGAKICFTEYDKHFKFKPLNLLLSSSILQRKIRSIIMLLRSRQHVSQLLIDSPVFNKKYIYLMKLSTLVELVRRKQHISQLHCYSGFKQLYLLIQKWWLFQPKYFDYLYSASNANKCRLLLN